MKLNFTFLAGLLSIISFHSSALAHKKAPETNNPSVEVCFVLDTTGSMGGLIAGAKRKIWMIADEVMNQQPKEMRFGLLGYRDRGDIYITRKTDLTTDLDAIHSALAEFQAQGGGDGPESVNQALKEAVFDFKWNEDPKVSKIIFLVGDAPPHMDYQDDIRYPGLCKEAREKGIIINTLLCGTNQNAATIWQEIAQTSGGSYAAIPQGSGTVAINTPYDTEINRCSVTLNKSVVLYGEEKQQKAVQEKISSINAAPSETQAARGCFNAKNAKGRVIHGRGDLLADWSRGVIKLDDIDRKKLSGDFSGLNEQELKAKLNEEKIKREALQKQLAAAVKKRDAFLAKEATKAPKDSFDQQVSSMITKQLKK